MCADGTFLTSSYDEGGECARLSYGRFVKSEGDEVDDPSSLAASASVPSSENASVSVSPGESGVTEGPPSNSTRTSSDPPTV